MESFFNLDWNEIFAVNKPALELIVRGSAIYWFLFLIFRFVIRRDVGSVGIADVLLLVIVADASQNAMAADYDTVSEGMILIGTLLFWNVFLDWMSYRFPAFRAFAQPTPLMLVSDGRLLRRNMRREFITDEELWAKLREEGVHSLDEVKRVFLEADGAISVIKRKK